MTEAWPYPNLILKKDFFADVGGIEYESVNRALVWVNRDQAPRDECFMSTRPWPYTYGQGRGVRTYEPIGYTALIEAIREFRQGNASAVETDYEACFANRYHGQHQHLGWHADDSPDIDHSQGIAVISFGAERELWFRANPLARDYGHDEANRPPVARLALPHNSVLVMPPGYQQTHQHRIPKHSGACGPRVSLTFRKLLPRTAS